MNQPKELQNKNSTSIGINFYLCVADFQKGKLTRITLQEAEAILAKHRKLPKFTWIEVFNDLELNEAAANKRIHPDKLAIIYLGEKVGYGVVALEEIDEGQILLFSGENRELLPEDANNPYLCTVKGFRADAPEKITVVDSQKTGGFASMVIDVPSDFELFTLKERAFSEEAKGKLSSIVYQNFNYELSIIDDKGEIKAGCLSASRKIKKNELLGCAYTASARLMYPFYAVFHADGVMASEEIISEMNKIAYKGILKRDTSLEIRVILKILKCLRDTKKHNRLTTRLSVYRDALDYLTQEELLACKEICAQPQFEREDVVKMLDDKIVQKSHSNPTDEQTATFQRERELLFLVRESNEKQIAHKGKGRLFFPDRKKQEYYMCYPGIEEDFTKIGKLHGTLGRPEVAQIYFDQVGFFQTKTHRQDSNPESNAQQSQTCS